MRFMNYLFSPKILLFLLALGINFSFAQTGCRDATKRENVLLNTRWKVDGVPFETADRETYRLDSIAGDNYDWHWGHFISFNENTFTSSYSAPCGNDCFTSVSGEYFFVAAMTIKVKVMTIDRHGFCSEKSETLNKDYGNYLVTKIETGWTLTKTE